MGQIDCIARVMISYMAERLDWKNPRIEEILNRTIAEEYASYLQSPDKEGLRYQYLTEQVLEGDNAANDVLDMALAVMFYPVFGMELKRETGGEATVKNAYLEKGIVAADSHEMKETYELLCRIFAEDRRKYPFFDCPFYVDNRLIGFLSGEDTLDVELADCASLYLAAEGTEREQIPWESKPEMERLCACMRDGESVWIPRVERQETQEILRKAANISRRNVIFLNLDKIEKSRRERVAALVVREAFFYAGCICLMTEKREEESGCLLFLREFERANCPICICAKEDMEILYAAHNYFSFLYFKDIGRYDRISIWKRMSERLGLPLDTEGYARKYPLNRSKLETVFYQLSERRTAGDVLTEKDVTSLCRSIAYMEADKGELIVPNPEMTQEKLVLSAEKKEILKKICNYEWYNGQVYRGWGLASEYVYGRGASALFTGPPGTGKTMAAYVISNMLDIPLYKVNLSQIADKYIGETEKHLEKVFDYAQRNHVILFFDEADAIFGKRSEVKDAKDRYANNEVSYILQRIEQYDGIVILTTNLKNNIDAAFMRRMKYIIHFSMPSEQERLLIWQKGFPKQLPVEEIDFSYLAAQFELSGGNIKNIILAAAFDAAGEQKAVNMSHILHAVRDEYAKYNKTMTPEEFGEYEILMREQ